MGARGPRMGLMSRNTDMVVSHARKGNSSNERRG